jgi:DNA modification methylase
MPDCTIICGDALQTLLTLPSSSVDCVVTSPPYYSVRTYGVEGEYGQEPDFHDYLRTMMSVFAEVRRVLKTSGTLWLNMGDCYGTDGKGVKRAIRRGAVGSDAHHRELGTGISVKSKSLACIPWRLASMMVDDGWILRNVVVWAKTNGMPHSVRDRFTNHWEPIFLFVRSSRYFFNLNAVRIPQVSGPSMAVWNELDGTTAYHNAEKVGSEVSASRTYAINTRKKSRLYTGHPLGKNPGDVWPISTVGEFEGHHFATFPERLVLPCVLAGCPEGGTVLDPFCGTGTTLVVALRTGRNALGIDLNPEYVDITRKRTSEALAQSTLFDRPAAPVVRQAFLDMSGLLGPVEDTGSSG